MSGEPLWIGLTVAAFSVVAAALTAVAKVLEIRARRRAAEAESASKKEAAAAFVAGPEPVPDPGSLPYRYKPFVNRRLELGEAEEQVRRGGEAVLVFEGERGIGKSEAVRELAHRLLAPPTAAARDLRAHEFVWVPPSEPDGRTTLADIGRSLNIETGDQSVTTGSTQVKLQRLRHHLAGRKTALVLDGLRLADDDESELLRAFLGTVPEGSLVIAAANPDEDLDGYRVPLKEFEVEDVRDLLVAQARRLGLDPPEQFDLGLARRLQEIVGGHPGTITLFLQAYKISGEGLDARLEALRAGRGLDRLFAPIWNSLDAGAREVLRSCQCLGGRATAAQLGAACEISEAEARRTAEKLYEEELLSIARLAGTPSFVISQALGIFVAGETSRQERSLRFHRLARHYVELVRRDPEDALALLPEVDALRAVFEGLKRPHLEGAEDPEAEADLQELFTVTLDVLLTLGLFDDRITAAAYAFDSAMRTADYRCASLAGEVSASTYALRGEFKAAESALQNGRIAADASGSSAEIARQMYSEGFLRYREEKPREALAAIEGAEERATAGKDLETLINVLDMRSAAHLYLAEVDACEAASERCLAVCEEIGWERAKAFPLRFLAEVAIHRGEMTKARELGEEARRLASAYHDQRQLARVRLTEARMHLTDRSLEAAEKAAAAAASEAQRLGLPPEEEEARALEEKARLFGRLPDELEEYVSRRPVRLTDAPVAGD